MTHSTTTACSKQTLGQVIAGLSSLIAEDTPSMGGLVALHDAREAINALFTDYSIQLRDSEATQSQWAAMRAALLVTDGPAIERECRAGDAAEQRENQRLKSFWNTHESTFIWDFLPMSFLHEAYLEWMNERHHREMPLSRYTFSRRLRAQLEESGCRAWRYARSRPGQLLRCTDPLATRIGWCHDGTNDAIYGLRRRRHAAA